jgi:hypothetical protein
MKKYLLYLLLLFITASGCAVAQKELGVANKWRGPDAPSIEVGETTQSDVLAYFGPPSQIISINDQVMFYYMLEQDKGEGVILIVYNEYNQKNIYDRALFIFDQEGILVDYSYSPEIVTHEKKKK